MKYILNIEEIKSFLLMNNHFFHLLQLYFCADTVMPNLKLYYFKASIWLDFRNLLIKGKLKYKKLSREEFITSGLI